MVVRKGAGVDKSEMDENERFFLKATIIVHLNPGNNIDLELCCRD